jgi:hypothetical protein
MRERIEADQVNFETDGRDSDSVEQAEPLSVARDILSRKPKKEVIIGLIPAPEPWQVPAVLRPGDWNDCPGPEVHVALFKRWYERYGAIVTSMSFDVIEFSVERPPRTMEDARGLAREQFVYCTDIVHQGVGTLDNLARALLNAGNWYFWWD